ncbi:MAG: antibiotic biosynthesis monooxygenase [Haloarculaceae archaeon]
MNAETADDAERAADAETADDAERAADAETAADPGTADDAETAADAGTADEAEATPGAGADRGADHASGDANSTGGAEAATAAHAPGGESDANDIQAELADLDIYAGKPHGEDVYALVLYSTADPETLSEETANLRDVFEGYDSHLTTAVYENEDSGASAVVSLWDSERAADRAGDHLADLPEVVGKPQDREGFGTMGMFYTVKPEHRQDFLEKFETVGDVLDDVEGHRATALLTNREDDNDMFIASRWDAKEDAMGFFRSDAFAQTVDWGRDVLDDRPRHVFLG